VSGASCDAEDVWDRGLEARRRAPSASLGGELRLSARCLRVALVGVGEGLEEDALAALARLNRGTHRAELGGLAARVLER
jgi:hypothetical protein